MDNKKKFLTSDLGMVFFNIDSDKEDNYKTRKGDKVLFGFLAENDSKFVDIVTKEMVDMSSDNGNKTINYRGLTDIMQDPTDKLSEELSHHYEAPCSVPQLYILEKFVTPTLSRETISFGKVKKIKCLLNEMIQRNYMAYVEESSRKQSKTSAHQQNIEEILEEAQNKKAHENLSETKDEVEKIIEEELEK